MRFQVLYPWFLKIYKDQEKEAEDLFHRQDDHPQKCYPRSNNFYIRMDRVKYFYTLCPAKCSTRIVIRFAHSLFFRMTSKTDGRSSLTLSRTYRLIAFTSFYEPLVTPVRSLLISSSIFSFACDIPSLSPNSSHRDRTVGSITGNVVLQSSLYNFHITHIHLFSRKYDPKLFIPHIPKGEFQRLWKKNI